MNEPTFDEHGHLATVVIDAKKLSELNTELAMLRKQVLALTTPDPAWENVVMHLAGMYEIWAKGNPVSVDSLMRAYDHWLD